MFTPEQEKWLEHLNNDDEITIMPWDPSSAEKFEVVKNEIQNVLGGNYTVLHRGASCLKISGQDEIDVYIPTESSKFSETIESIMQLYGTPRSCYDFKRARFVTKVEDKHIDIFVVNKDDEDWKNSETFYAYLLSHPDTLNEYEKLKESLSGKSTRIYYSNKIEFINKILFEAKSESK